MPPTFHRDVSEAYNEMTSLESPNDFFIASFAPTNGSDEELNVFAKGKGGLARVREILLESFTAEVAVAMFRVTAVDDRGGKVKSFRTKLVHVVYIGPKTPVMKRAKVASWNAAFKQPFTMNLSIQTDDAEGDLSETQLERALRASGGAHQPTYFDFTNSATSSGEINTENSYLSAAPPSPSASPSHAGMNPPRSPSGNRSYVACWNEQNRAFHARSVEELKRQYAEDYCKLIITDTALGFAVYEGVENVAEAFAKFFESYHDAYEIVKVEKTQPDGDHTSEGIVFSHWVSENGTVQAAETLCIVGGKIVVHTLFVSRVGPSPSEAEAEEVEELAGEVEEDTLVNEKADEQQETQSQATADEETEDVTSNAAEAGGEVMTTPEPQESVASNEDGFVEVAPSQEDTTTSQPDESIQSTEAGEQTHEEEAVDVEEEAPMDAQEQEAEQ